jgi:hypothetical protein
MGWTTMNDLNDIFREIHQNGTAKSHVPWYGSENGNRDGHHHKKTIERENIDVCLNCKRKKCNGSCRMLKTNKTF